MKEPLTGREIIGLHIYHAIGDRLAEVARTDGDSCLVRVTRWAYDILHRDMPGVFFRDHAGTEFMHVWDRHNIPWTCTARVELSQKNLPWIERVPAENGTWNVRLTYGVRRKFVGGAVKMV